MMIDQMGIGERIKAIRGNLSGKEFAKKIGVTFTVVSAYENGKAWPKPQTLDKIIKLSGRPADWLLYGIESDQPCVIDPPADYSSMVSMPVYALAGAGAPCCIDGQEPICHICVEKKMDGPNIRVIEVRGTSMEPTLLDGSYVGVDVTDKNVISGKLYAVYLPYEGIVVKRIWIGPELVKIESDNKAAPSHDMSIDRINWDTFIQGRVKWWIVQEG